MEKLTFKDTRVFVGDVLDMVAEGYSWNYIEEQWNGGVTKDAIKEAVVLSKDSSSGLLDIISRETARQNLRDAVKLGEKYGFSNTTIEEIDEEIKAVRKHSKS